MIKIAKVKFFLQIFHSHVHLTGSGEEGAGDGLDLQEEGGEAGSAAAPPSGSSRNPTLQEIMMGLDLKQPLPPHLQLTMVGSENLTAINLTAAALEKKKIVCHGRNISENETMSYEGVVQIVNSSQLLQRLGFKNSSYANCAVVLFYAPWCPFCAKAAPHFNALPRAFPIIDFLAIDAINFNK